MASINSLLSTQIITTLILLLLSLTTTVVTAVPEREFTSMLAVLSNRGYHLFSNAITTSELHYDILSGNSSFTFFAPPDSSLFALDMASTTATDYVAALLYHVVPRRISLADLRGIDGSSNSSLRTLLDGRKIFVERSRSPRQGLRDVITVDGVNVVFPGLFYGRHLAVHGLASILSIRSQVLGSRHGAAVMPPDSNINFANLSIAVPPSGDIHAPMVDDGVDNRTALYHAPEPASDLLFPPANSPGSISFPPDIPPEDGRLPGVPTISPWAPRTESPAPSVNGGNTLPVLPPPSSGGIMEGDDGGVTQSDLTSLAVNIEEPASEKNRDSSDFRASASADDLGEDDVVKAAGPYGSLVEKDDFEGLR